MLDALFLHMFRGLNERHAHELATIGAQYPFEPLKFLDKSPRIEFAEGVRMLREAGYEMDDMQVCMVGSD